MICVKTSSRYDKLSPSMEDINNANDEYLPLSGGNCTGKVTMPELGISPNVSFTYDNNKQALRISFI